MDIHEACDPWRSSTSTDEAHLLRAVAGMETISLARCIVPVWMENTGQSPLVNVTLLSGIELLVILGDIKMCVSQISTAVTKKPEKDAKMTNNTEETKAYSTYYRLYAHII